jgi:hypothetical protein
MDMLWLLTPPLKLWALISLLDYEISDEKSGALLLITRSYGLNSNCDSLLYS